ncbi:MAG: hypothetical protein ACLQUY_18650 [Ktedonobacterales bacterium]
MSELFAGDIEFFIAAPDLPPAVAELRAAAPTADEAYGVFSWGEKALAASEGQEPAEAIRRIFDALGWELLFDPDGNIVDMQLTKFGSRDTSTESYLHPLFYTLAPFVRAGSHVQVLTDDGADFVYHFQSGRCDYKTNMDPLVPYKADPLVPNNLDPLVPYYERDVVLRLDLAERILAYLRASGVAGEGAGAALAAELERALHPE